MNRKVKFVLLFFLFSASLIYSHELAHAAIAKNHGCLESKIGVDLPNLRAYHQCLEYKPDRTDEMKLQERQMHSLNEIIGYPIEPLVYLIFLTVYMFGGKRNESSNILSDQ